MHSTIVTRLFMITIVPLFVICLAAGVSADNVKGSLKAPEEGNLQKITLTDGSTLMGKITEVGDTTVTFETSAGEMKINISGIKSIEEIPQSSMRGGKYWFPNPNSTRLYLGQTARMLPKGKGYFQDIYVFFPGVAYAFTDFFTMGAGFSLIPGLGMNEQVFYFTPKLGFEISENLWIAGSMLIIRFPDPDDDDDIIDEEVPLVGTLSGVVTYGTDIVNGTLGLGFGYVDDQIADKPAVMFGGEWRFARRVSFVSENWVIPEIDEPVVSYGIRFFGEGIAADLALWNILDEDAIFPGIPYVSFVYNF